MNVDALTAIQMADLGAANRDKVYAPDADASGRPLDTSPAAQAAMAQAAAHHRDQALASGDSRAMKWNTPSNFEDVGEHGLTNFADGQGYRIQVQRRGQVGFDRDLHYATPFSSSNGGGTIYYGSSGSRGMPPNSIASGGQSRYAEFVAAQRGQVDTSLGQDSSRDQGRGPRGRRAQNQANKNGGPRRKPRETKESKVLRDLVFPTKPSTAPKPSAMEVQAKQQVDDLVTASKAGQLGEMMLRSQKDFPGVTNLKIIITDGAIESSNPSGPVLNRPAECIHVFHATREWLVDVTFYILSLGDGPLLQNKLEVMRSKVSPRYEATLFAVVVQAKKDVATKSYVALEPEYRRLGKLDVLEKAMELRHAEKATQNAQPIDMVSNDPDVNDHDIQDTAAHVAPDSSSTAQPDAAEVATDTAAHVTAEGSSAAQPDAVEVATMDVPDTAELGTAELAFTIDGTDGEGRLTLDLPAGLEVDVHMTVNTNFSYLKNYEIFLDAFGSMVATLRLRIEAAKATDAVKVTEDAAVEAASSGSSGFGSDASFQIIRSPAMYSDDSDDSDDDSL